MRYRDQHATDRTFRAERLWRRAGAIAGRALIVLAATIAVLASTGGGAHAQQVVAVVYGEPITDVDIAQRTRLIQLSTRKTPSRKDVLEELIDEKLKLREGKRFGLVISKTQLDAAFDSTAERLRMTSKQFTQVLKQAGISPDAFKEKMQADLTWSQLVRGRYSARFEVGERDIEPLLPAQSNEVGYDYILRPVVLVVPQGSSSSVIAARKRDAEDLRKKFVNCDQGIPYVRAMREAVVRPQIVRSSADLQAPIRKMLDDTPIGRLTPPEVGKLGIEMFAICERRETKETPLKREARQKLLTERFDEESKKYLEEIRRSALIEYK